MIEFYHHLFGVHNVHVFCYEGFAQDNLAFIEEYSRQLNLQFDIEEIEFSVVNPGINVRAVTLKRLVNLLYKDGRQPKRHLVNMPWLAGKLSGAILRYSKLRGRRPSFSEDLLGRSNVQYILNYYAEINRDLISMLDLPLSQYNYPGCSR
jgi:hypothetical protein